MHHAFSIILGAMEALCKYLLTNRTNVFSFLYTGISKSPEKKQADFSGLTTSQMSMQKKSENCEQKLLVFKDQIF